jgi:hypothetical protein
MTRAAVDPRTAVTSVECQQVLEQTPSELCHSGADRQLQRGQAIAWRRGERRRRKRREAFYL